MLKNAFIYLMLIIYFPLAAADSLLVVTATSGLTLRATPEASGEPLTVLPHGIWVQDMTSEVHPTVTDQVGYFNGEWVYVTYEDFEGYVFNAYLSSLDLPSESFEKTQFELDVTYPLESYIMHRKNEQFMDTITNDLFSKTTIVYQDGWRMERKNTDHLFELKVEMPNVRLAEAYQLLYNMLSTAEEREKYSRFTLFLKNNQNVVDRIKIDFGDQISLTEDLKGVNVVVRSQKEGCAF